ncbi:MAG: hypothetical protein LBI16_02485 [Burkholderiales bacterium]|nr:hypothetical protein [Burkholderiales bacterium]
MIRRLGILCAGLLVLLSTNLLALTINTANRTEVSYAYDTIYVSASNVPSGWNGNIAGTSCDAGTTTLAHQKATITTANFYRALAKLPPVYLISDIADPTATDPAVVQDSAVVNRARQAALILSVNPSIPDPHNPVSSDRCYSQAGHEGASASNLSLGYPSSLITGPGAIDGYINEDSANAGTMGHRRWVLYTQQIGLATGDIVNPIPTGYSANALRVSAASGEPSSLFRNASANPSWVTWPSPNFVPSQLIPSSGLWTISYPGANFGSATVTMTTSDGNDVPVTGITALPLGFGDNTLLFKPSGLPDFSTYSDDTSYKIIVSNVTGADNPSYCYTVTVFDPSYAGDNSTAPDLCNAQAPTLSGLQSASYIQNQTASALSVTAEVTDGGTLSYQWYGSAVNDNTAGTAIEGAVGSDYTPSTATVGTMYYYVVVTNTNPAAFGAKTAETVSSPVMVRVYAPAANIINLSDDNPPTSGIGWTYSGGADGVYTILNGADVIVIADNQQPDPSERRLKVAAGATATITLDNASITDLDEGQSALLLNTGADVTLVLADGSTNTLAGGYWSAGIQTTDATLTINSADDNAVLNATGGSSGFGTGGGAGIGGGDGGDGGTIIINGGTIKASGNGGAGIGGGDSGGGDSGHGGNITINGGTITADGSGGGAGIGGGVGGGFDGDGGKGGNITINGGIVTVSSDGGAGIGGGYCGASGNITINDGTVTIAIDHSGVGAGIGSGGAGGLEKTSGNITINGGTINVTSSRTGAGIGSGYNSSVDDITITEGRITITCDEACTNNGAGIGSGAYGAVGNITITGGTIMASGFEGAGIGGGESGTVGNITIDDGTINATSSFSAGIGSGLGDYVGNIAINGGTINATSSFGAGIGSGSGGGVIDITITGGEVTANGGDSIGVAAGIGSGYIGTFGSITINGDAEVTATGGSGGAGIGGQEMFAGISTIAINGNAKVTATGGFGVYSGGGVGGGAGIGGNAYNTNNTSSAITISGNAEVTATGGDGDYSGGGAGIGSGGTYDTSPVPAGTISIASTGTITATGGKGGVFGGDNYTDGANIGEGGYKGSTPPTPLSLYTITASAGANGNITPSGNVTVNEGADVTYTITADPGHSIVSVLVDSVDNPAAVTSRSYTFTNVTGNHTIAATFTSGGIGPTNSINLSDDNPLTSGIGWTYSGGADGIYTILDGADVIVIGDNQQPGPSQRRLEVAPGATATITLDNASITGLGSDSALMLNTDADVTLVLADGSTNTLRGGSHTVNAGIQTTDATLTINSADDSAVLNAISGWYGAGIGGGDGGHGDNGGNITINGGTINATGDSGAGIGGGYRGSSGNTTINGGTINATGNSGAGIGGGRGSNSGNITINGGTINATSSDGAGIGSGSDSGGGLGSTSGDITINGGTITVSGSVGAGIGSGVDGRVSNITITGGTITVSSWASAGIGSGAGQYGTVGDITITGGTIYAICDSFYDDHVGIGGGSLNTVGNITISGDADVTAIGCAGGGAGIGGDDSGTVGNITINGNATVIATGGGGGAGIGGSKRSDGGTITINGNATVTAIGGDGDYSGGGAGIGSGGTDDTSPVPAGTISIATTGTITATGGKGGVFGGDNYTDGANIGEGGYKGSTPPTPLSLYAIVASAGANGSIVPNGTVTVSEGTNVTFTITADDGYSIASVLIDGTNNPAAVASGSYMFTNVTGNHTIVAAFTLGGTATITIDTQPQNATVTEGAITESLTIAATVTPSGTPSYQWYSNTTDSNVGGTLLVSATGANFAIPTTLTAAGSPYYYYCVVSASGATSVASDVAKVTVTAAPVPVVTSIAVTTQPTTLSYTEGEALNLSGLEVTLSYSDGASVDVLLSDFGTSNLTTEPAAGTTLTVAAHNGNPVTVIYDNSATLRADTTPLTVTAAPIYSISLDQGGTYNFGSAVFGYGTISPLTVTVTNTGNQPTSALTVALSGANAGSFTISSNGVSGGIAVGSSAIFNVAPNLGLLMGTYTATITTSGANGISASFNVTFEVLPATSGVTITIQPAFLTTVIEGSITGSLTVAATVTPSGVPTYQWYSNTVMSNVGGVPILGETGASFVIPSDLVPGTYYYYCVVSASGMTSVTSIVAIVRVNARGGPGSLSAIPALNSAMLALLVVFTLLLGGAGYAQQRRKN